MNQSAYFLSQGRGEEEEEEEEEEGEGGRGGRGRKRRKRRDEIEEKATISGSWKHLFLSSLVICHNALYVSL